ncbi:PIR Superfamily Protein [Plasmodium ovale curtisi]|uniref:PIR Superfamily Protein n=1 Tax=Plasmodium ovale curtisi TaxID=864141 RepID=A0A1A8WHQ3_PLAOA|nr:PIR Superfamily Protein [Plasmodium ovale curtisi]
MEQLEEGLTNLPEFVFYGKLDDDYDKHEPAYIDDYLNQCYDCSSKDSIKKYVLEMVRNYNRYSEYINHNSQMKYCRFLKHWLFRKKYSFKLNPRNDHNAWDRCIPCVWGKLEQKNSQSKCDFDNENYPNAIVSMRIYLDEYCSIMEQLGGKNEIISNKEKCLIYNKKKHYYMNYILQMISSISNDTTFKKKYFTIHDNCSLNKIDTLFPEIPCTFEGATRVDASEESSYMQTCPQQEQVECPPTEELTVTESTMESFSCSSTQIFFVIGITFLFTLTPFGSWLHNRLKKRSIVLDNLSDEITEELLEGNSNSTDQIDESIRRYISYEPF